MKITLKFLILFQFSIFFLLAFCLNASEISYYKDIKPIILNHCIQCHHKSSENSIDFEIDNNVIGMHKMIQYVTSNHIMPPWPLNPNIGRFHNENFLSSSDILMIKTWSENNAPKGKIKDFKNEVRKNKTKQRPHDFELKVDTSLVITPLKPEYYFDVFFKSKEKFLNTTLIEATEIEFNNKKLVHHMRLDLDSFTSDIPYDTRVLEVGKVENNFRILSPTFAGYLPGNGISKMPKGFAVEMYSNPFFYASLHLISDKLKDEKFNFKVKLWKANDSIASRIVVKRNIFNKEEAIRGQKIKKDSMFYIHTISKPIRRKKTVVAIWPHMHLLGERMKIYYILESDTTIIMDIDKWNFNWQYKYFFKKPFVLPKGAYICCDAVYNNTSSNKFNPNNPTKDVKFGGMSSTDEMLNLFFYVTDYMKGDRDLVFDYDY